MYAIARRYAYDPTRRTEAEHALAEVQILHADQPGYAGSLVIDDGRQLTAVNLWESEPDADAGREAIGSQVRSLLEPLMEGPSELITAGEIVVSDIAARS